MARSKLNFLINSFSENDWKQFLNFAKSRFSDNSELHKIARYLKKHHSNPQIIDSTNEELWKMTKSKMKLKTFSNTIPILCSHIEAFLVWQEVNHNADTYQTMLASSLSRRNMKDLFHKVKSEREKYKKKHLGSSFWYDYNSIKLNYAHYFNSMSTKVEEGEIVLRESLKNLTAFYKSLLHFYAIEVNNRLSLTDEIWDEEINLIQSYKFIHRNAEIYNALIDLKLHKDLTIFQSLWSILERQHQELSYEVRYVLLIHLISFASHMSKRNTSYDGPKNNDLYKWGLENDVLLQEGSRPHRRLYNMIYFLSLEMDKDTLLNLIDQIFKKVDKLNSKEVKNLAYAIVAFQNNDPELSENLLNQVSFKHVANAVTGRVLMLKIYYTLRKDNYDFLDRQVDNFNYFIRRYSSVISSSTESSLKNFAKYFQKLIDKENIKELLPKIQNEEYLMARNWLLKTIQASKRSS